MLVLPSWKNIYKTYISQVFTSNSNTNLKINLIFLIGLGAVLFQFDEDNKIKYTSYNSRILNLQEQKLLTLDRDPFGIVYFKYMSSLSLDFQTRFTYLQITNLFSTVLQNLTKLSKPIKISILQANICLLQTCSVVLLQNLNFN